MAVKWPYDAGYHQLVSNIEVLPWDHKVWCDRLKKGNSPLCMPSHSNHMKQ